jgi:hypothetical protein
LVRVAQPRRGGIPVQVSGRPVDFSYWPMRWVQRGYSLHTRVFTADPWTLIRQGAESRCLAQDRSAAAAFVEQALAFYRSATTAGTEAAKPLLLYYCFLNLFKAYVLVQRQRTAADVEDQAIHGLSERMHPGGRSIDHSYLRAYPSTVTHLNMFDEVLRTLSGTGQAATTDYEIVDLLPMVLTGHRFWTAAEGHRNERFVAIDRLEFMHNPSDGALWLRLRVLREDLARGSVGFNQLLRETGLDGTWRQVEEDRASGGQGQVWFEQLTPLRYTRRPSDEIPALVSTIRPHLWASVRIVSPYRKYYLFRRLNAGLSLPQIASVYALMFYFGSVTRYRPPEFNSILTAHSGEFGHPVRLKSATWTGPNRPPVPAESGHPERERRIDGL